MLATIRALAIGLLFLTAACESRNEADTAAASQDDTIVIGTIKGAIGPVTMDYVTRVLAAARTSNAHCVIFKMDTPGGLDASMRGIIKEMLSSPFPIVMYVYPSGGRAASAGAIIMLASHVGAMAPSTNMGAAHPVSMGGGQMDSTMTSKVTNDAAAYARGLAKDRGRDVDWAERIVRESISSTAEEALELGVIDIVATDIDDLVEQLHGREVTVSDATVTLQTREATLVENAPSFRERLLARITDPNIAYLLMLLGIFGIFFELQNPGAIFPGVIGGIAILLAFYALQLLPVNYAGLALIILAIVMFLLEVKIPSGGLLTVGGVVAMLIGSIMFIDSPLPFMRVSFGVIIPAVIFTALFFLFAVGMGIRAQKKKVATGSRGILGEIGTARTDVTTDSGSVFVHGEHWRARSEQPIADGSRVEIIGVDGMTLTVKEVTDKEVT
jgi:membrane-bound serine protease (ClpP class)